MFISDDCQTFAPTKIRRIECRTRYNKEMATYSSFMGNPRERDSNEKMLLFMDSIGNSHQQHHHNEDEVVHHLNHAV